MSDDDSKLDLDVTDNKEDKEEVLILKMGDDLIAVIRELVQLSILTGTNVVDHFRAITCEIDPDSEKLVPTEEYVDAYNDMIGELVQKAEESREALEANELATISAEDLASGKIAGTVVDDAPQFGYGRSSDSDSDNGDLN